MLALRPVPMVERGLDWLLSPTAVLQKMTAPLTWLQTRGVHAAEDGADIRAVELQQQAEMETAVVDSSTPTSGELLARLGGRRALRAEVIGRSPGDRDRIRIRVQQPEAIQDGLPVVTGDAFVGLVDLGASKASSLASDVFEVRLVTGSRFRVGAIVRDLHPAGRMVVGGIASRARGVMLDVHNPENRRLNQGRVTVEEPAVAKGYTHLANGFVLGDLVGLSDGNRSDPGVPALQPWLDYSHGLHQVLVLTEHPSSGDLQSQAPLPEAGRWPAGAETLRGESSPRRKGRKLFLGSSDHVVPGAAVAAGVRFVGRIVRSGTVMSDVALVRDEGLRFSAIAMAQLPSGAVVPHVLGELVSRGGDEPGWVELLWSASLPLSERAGHAFVPVAVWTGSGDPGVPRGLLVGQTRLPTGPGPHVLKLQLATGVREPAELKVWVPRGIEQL